MYIPQRPARYPPPAQVYGNSQCIHMDKDRLHWYLHCPYYTGFCWVWIYVLFFLWLVLFLSTGSIHGGPLCMADHPLPYTMYQKHWSPAPTTNLTHVTVSSFKRFALIPGDGEALLQNPDMHQPSCPLSSLCTTGVKGVK